MKTPFKSLVKIFSAWQSNNRLPTELKDQLSKGLSDQLNNHLDKQHLNKQRVKNTNTESANAFTNDLINDLTRAFIKPSWTPNVGNAPAVDVAPGQFEAGRFTYDHQQRDYKLYIPKHSTVNRLPLILMLHGCTQGADDFALGTGMNILAEQWPCLVLYPIQNTSANSSKCWNWFQPAHQQRDHGEPAFLAALTQHIMQSFAVDSDRVYVAGLSAGAAMAAILGVTYPELYAAVALHSGLPYGAAKDLPSALNVMRSGVVSTGIAPSVAPLLSAPLIVFQGDKDTTVHLQNATAVLAQHVAFANASCINSSNDKNTSGSTRPYIVSIYTDASQNATVFAEIWIVKGLGHAWSGGNPQGTYTDPAGPSASNEIMRFFTVHPHPRLAD